MENVLLIDGKNAAYRAVFAMRGNPEFRRNRYHPFVIWLRFVHVWLVKFRPISCHVFWDCPKDQTWRKKILKEYKDHRDGMNHYEPEVQRELKEMISAAVDILPYMGVRQYMRDGQESDDLIYAACRMLNPGKANHKLIIVSSDSDFLQLQWSMHYVSCYHPQQSKICGHPECDPVIQKALCGDKADNIEGFRGIGPIKSKALASSPQSLLEFLKVADRSKLHRNMALIDLSINPSILSNQLYILGILAQDARFDKTEVQNRSIKHHAHGMMSEWSRIAAAFKCLK